MENAVYCGEIVTTRLNGLPSSWCEQHHNKYMLPPQGKKPGRSFAIKPTPAIAKPRAASKQQLQFDPSKYIALLDAPRKYFPDKTKATVYGWYQNGHLPTDKVGGRVVVLISDMEKFAAGKATTMASS
jgi:hypothetical protein